MSVSFTLHLSKCVINSLRRGPHGAFSKATMFLSRNLWRAMAVVAVGIATIHNAQAQPSYTVSVDQIQKKIAQRFPMRYPMAGLLDLDVQAPQLDLLPKQNRISARMAIDATGPLLQRGHSGTFDVDFALRYEISDNTIRAYRLNFQNLRIAGFHPQASELLNTYGPALAQQALQEVVLYQLRPQDLVMADTLGMQPHDITVTEKGLVIGFVLKPLRARFESSDVAKPRHPQ